ncbi:glycosyltransferase family 2 protein [Schaalia sp. ZJ405]|uniref:glycosyltransferase family 2 protein n=1 Tax=Schaalia sp. ZJ405 TaxID=2709403 RepID=UPI001E33254F|nr:glycosyltransferase [Schaalia sp. ZJ405]
MTTPTRTGIAALIVTRGESPDLRAVLKSVGHQTLAADHCVVIDVAGSSNPVLNASALPADVTLIHIGRAPNLGEAIRRATREPLFPSAVLSARWWWILHDDSQAEPSCLQHLWEVGDQGRTIAAVGPKQLSWDGEEILELGIFATRSARRLNRVSEGEIDQGQYDSTSDVLAVGTAGMLIDPQAWFLVGGTDPMLGPFGDGLDLGRRLHRAGYRVVVAPKARIRHRRASLTPSTVNDSDEDERANARATADPADEDHSDVDARRTHDDSLELRQSTAENVVEIEAAASSSSRETRRQHPADESFGARRFAQLYNWAKATPILLLPFLAIALLVWTPARALARVATNSGHLALAEFGAWGRLIGSTGHLLVAKWKAQRTAKVPASTLRSLETTPRELTAQRSLDRRIARAHRVTHAEPLVEESLRSHRMSTAVTFAVVLAVSIIASIGQWWFVSGPLTGGAWTALPEKWSTLWEAAWAAWIPGGDGHPSPADPILGVLALLSWPAHVFGVAPNLCATAILVSAGPLSAASMWVLSRRFTASTTWRAAAACTWSVLPALTMSQFQGRLGATIVHCVLPLVIAAWMSLLHLDTPVRVAASTDTVTVTSRRFTGAIGAASLSGAVVVAGAPWMLVVILILGCIVLGVSRGPRRWAALPMMLTPTVLVAPIVITAIAGGHTWRALVTPGGGASAYVIPQGWQVFLGVPSAAQRPLDLAFSLVPGTLLIIGAFIAVAPTMKASSADASSPRRRMLPALALLAGVVFAGCGLAIARIHVAIDAQVAATAWASPALSLAGLALIVSILSAIPFQHAWNGPRMLVITRLGLVAAIIMAACGAGPIVARVDALGRDNSLSNWDRLHNTHVSVASAHLVSAVSAQAEESVRAGRVLVLDADANIDTLNVSLWRGRGPMMTDESSVTRARALNAAVQRASTGAQAHESAAGTAPAHSDAAENSLAQLALTLVASPDASTVLQLADHGIDTILIPARTRGRDSMSEALGRAPGLEKVGDTDAGTVWRLRPKGLQPARMRVLSGSSWSVIESGQISAHGRLPEGTTGTLTLAERADPHWHARIDGHPLEPSRQSWNQEFTVESGGELAVYYRTWWQLPWWITLGILGAASLVLAVPVRRNRS